MKAVETLADLYHDGHYTIFKFTTHYKAMWGTPNLDTGEGRDQVLHLPACATLDEALSYLLESVPLDALLDDT